jgi:hypothetical protein
MRNIIGSMLFAKDLQILKKEPKSRAIEEDHVVELDASFRHPSLVRTQLMLTAPPPTVIYTADSYVMTPCSENHASFGSCGREASCFRSCSGGTNVDN